MPRGRSTQKTTSRNSGRGRLNVSSEATPRTLRQRTSSNTSLIENESFQLGSGAGMGAGRGRRENPRTNEGSAPPTRGGKRTKDMNSV